MLFKTEKGQIPMYREGKPVVVGVGVSNDKNRILISSNTTSARVGLAKFIIEEVPDGITIADLTRIFLRVQNNNGDLLYIIERREVVVPMMEAENDTFIHDSLMKNKYTLVKQKGYVLVTEQKYLLSKAPNEIKPLSKQTETPNEKRQSCTFQ